MGFFYIILMLILALGGFCREVRIERKRFAQKRQRDNEHILKEAERFVAQQKQIDQPLP